ncbi:MAG: glycosyltransferase family 2 protein [Saprospiraceae bacterium]|nr:MAG: glycosyltransferase family 2 protein [Saprospiraceae bacterium]
MTQKNNSPLLSVICPTLNEESYIENILSFFIEVSPQDKELYIVDGGSTDGTKKKVLKRVALNPEIHLIENPDRFVSTGFNKAFIQTKGKYLSLIGAHAIYPLNYFSTCIKAISTGECDAAGGILIQSGKTNMGKAIGRAMSSQFGVGNTAFRTSRKRMYVDSVAFAVYDRKVFEKCGFLNEELIRNQDDEFHYRLNQAGFRILMLPELEVIYYVRDSFSKLFSQYYQYGLYKPLVFKKVRTGMRMRHLIPSFFVLYLFSLPLALWLLGWGVPLLIYILLSILFGFRGSAPWKIKLLTPVVFPVLHIAYGLGFLFGFRKLI